MQSLLFLGAFQALFLSVLLFTKANKNKSDYILIAFLIFTALPLGYYYLYFDQIVKSFSGKEMFPNLLYFINIPFIMTLTPTIYLYIKSYSSDEKKFFRKNFIHYLPVLIFILLTIFFVDFEQVKNNGFFSLNFPLTLIFLSFTPLTVIFAGFYIIRSFSLLKKLNSKLQDNFSNTENMDLRWIRFLLISFAIVWLLLLPFVFFLVKLQQMILLYEIILVTIVIFILIIAFYGFKQSAVFLQPVNNTEIKNENSHKNKEIEIDSSNPDIKKLLDFMEKEKPYLNYDLTLAQLAEKLDWTPQYLSKLLNKSLSKNFFEFINYYRVEEVKKRLKTDAEKYTILAIAYECGFNSKSSFNRIFKNFTGKTPSEFKNSAN